MAWKRSEQWWRRQGYSQEPGTHRAPGKTTRALSRLIEQTQPTPPSEIPITYYPTRTSNPADPRTAAMGYDRDSRTMVVEWGDGGPAYWYSEVTPSEWRRMRRTASPGRLINQAFNSKPYGPV